jgi:hypothetical protein
LDRYAVLVDIRTGVLCDSNAVIVGFVRPKNS